jgi:uncharacterized protein (TIGR03435 family)
MRQRSIRRVLLFGVGFLLLVLPVTTRAQADAKLAFEVASVKPNSTTNAPAGVRLLPSGQLVATNIAVRAMIATAWGSEAIQMSSQIVGGPGWIDGDHYDINAKASNGFSEKDVSQTVQRVEAMLRALLEERFQVKVHTEMREVPIYALVLANKEPRFGTLFKPSAAKCYTRQDPPPRDAPLDPARQCGIRGGNGNVTYVNITMQDIARSFANYPAVGRPVIDRTGLTERYDLHMEFTPAFVDSPNRDGSQVANPAADSGPNLFTALVEQAGLKLQPERGPVQFIVIDHVERPTPD